MARHLLLLLLLLLHRVAPCPCLTPRAQTHVSPCPCPCCAPGPAAHAPARHVHGRVHGQVHALVHGPACRRQGSCPGLSWGICPCWAHLVGAAVSVDHPCSCNLGGPFALLWGCCCGAVCLLRLCPCLLLPPCHHSCRPLCHVQQETPACLLPGGPQIRPRRGPLLLLPCCSWGLSSSECPCCLLLPCCWLLHRIEGPYQEPPLRPFCWERGWCHVCLGRPLGGTSGGHFCCRQQGVRVRG
jgi:hypothetical protein